MTNIIKKTSQSSLTDEEKVKLLACHFHDLLFFTRTFFPLRTGREFDLSNPPGRESHYITIVQALEKVVRGKTKRLIINVPPRYGKAIDICTPILTKEGWTIAGEIKRGDEIVGSKGWTKVKEVYPQGLLAAKQVRFSDNQSVICNAEHLWNVCDRYTPKFKTLTTERIEHTLYEADERKHWKIPLIDGEYGEMEPFMDPYLFGCWLGDGHSHYAAITTMDEEIIHEFIKFGFNVKLYSHQNSGVAKTYGILGLSKILRQNGLLKNKHIPEECYRWSKKDRLSLLQGLMDTDGTCGKNGQVSFTNTNKDIIKGCGYLVNSLGGIYRTYERTCGTQTLNIRLPDELKPFRLFRKQQYVSQGIYCSPRRFISEIIDIDPVEMICFEVNAEDQLFAVGEGLILTHNTELLIHFVAWAMARYSDSNFLYVSYSHTLAKKQTQTIRDIITLQQYKELFDVRLKEDTTAKDNFETSAGGSVYAAGAQGTITGFGAGIKGSSRFGGCIVIDDIHKPDEVTSDTIRESINEWYFNTLHSRLNNPNTPIIFIGQRLHEDDLAANLLKNEEWESVILPAIDAVGNPLNPKMHDLATLYRMKEESPYNFASQYQQNPQPAGGGIFKRECFHLHDIEPHILETFITVDSAETEKDYNDWTVFSFWGLYRIKDGDIETDEYALHWLDCLQLHIEPKDLLTEFRDFYRSCTHHRVRPKIVGVEKKSTGVTLASVLSNMQGLQTIGIDRTKASGSKTARFLEMQSFIGRRLISLPTYGNHTSMCIEHMIKITSNNSHRFDDICDTAYDAIRLALIEKVILNKVVKKDDSNLARNVMSNVRHIDRLRKAAYKN